MKTLGLGLISALIAVTGNIIGRQKLKRIEIIEQIILMIKSVNSQIIYSRLSVPDILKFLINSEEFLSLGFIEDTFSYLQNGQKFEKAWQLSILEFARFNPIKKEDINLLNSFALGLGNTDVEGQKANCETYIELFSFKAENLRKSSESSVKICNSLGMITAALVFIIFY